MERTIAMLLDAFEQGRVNRRQLIQSLAVAATGAHALGSVTMAQAATPARGAPAAFKTAGIGSPLLLGCRLWKKPRLLR